ncbi:beta-xylosidase [Rubellimicrobium sp. CFH 75288]|uniref:beta-xylosidase n=1 Tax=Rubellimicrobium sp. CFH 75288 TaxID=2697034 RepID=UPI00141204B7|nr:beta-xylosidase [Rubellimicrobium sp. CFH 75288]NAZ37556.1 beta-xylosidase [Rubellimicrobium sp. CFH 75288]
MIESVMFWNEPNNKSHWNPALDPDWSVFSAMVAEAGRVVAHCNPGLTRVMGGMSPIDPGFVERLERLGALEAVDVVAVHGFPLDWNLWPIGEWPDRIAEIERATALPVWVSEVGVGSFGAEEVQEWGLRRTAELLLDRVERVYWYSLLDLPRTWEATTRHKEAEGSSYYRHFYMGLIREDGTPKPGLETYAALAGRMGIMQWFHFEDPRLEDAVAWMRRLGVRRVRTGLSWADSFRPGAWEWFDRQMAALEGFEVMATLCFTPGHLGVEDHHTSPPRDPSAFAEFCGAVVERYAPARPARAAAGGRG